MANTRAPLRSAPRVSTKVASSRTSSPSKNAINANQQPHMETLNVVKTTWPNISSPGAGLVIGA